MFLFFFNFHNEVNKRLNKPVMSYKNAAKKYLCGRTSLRDGVEDEGPKTFTFILGMALVVLLIYVYFFRRRRK
jgi:hypothetical protein